MDCEKNAPRDVAPHTHAPTPMNFEKEQAKAKVSPARPRIGASVLWSHHLNGAHTLTRRWRSWVTPWETRLLRSRNSWPTWARISRRASRVGRSRTRLKLVHVGAEFLHHHFRSHRPQPSQSVHSWPLRCWQVCKRSFPQQGQSSVKGTVQQGVEQVRQCAEAAKQKIQDAVLDKHVQ